MHVWDIISTGLTAVGIGLELTRIWRGRKRAADEATAGEAALPGEQAAEPEPRRGESADVEGAPDVDDT
ncbi:hypothetical protein ALMP_35900 [Streptomyces sp. A012304]|nr:hypothetical protein ALMP_35900 [Streptomyces sp. A012304]